jgi:uncharacterized membrane-anchored protein YitT (DUF2179 family)
VISYALGWSIFLLPNNLIGGGVSGFASILYYATGLSMGVTYFILNVILLIVGTKILGTGFGGKTIYSSVLMPVIMRVYEVVIPEFTSINGDPLVDMLCYILLVGMGLSLIFHSNASSGGLDILAKLMNKYLRIEMGKAVAIPSMVVALSSILFYDVKSVILSVIGTYFSGIMVDYFIFGMSIKRRVCIFSSKTDEIVHYILHDLHSGASLYPVEGAYGKEPRTEVVAIVNKQEYTKLMAYLQKTDPKAFITVYAVNEVSYIPKKIK